MIKQVSAILLFGVVGKSMMKQYLKRNLILRIVSSRSINQVYLYFDSDDGGVFVFSWLTLDIPGLKGATVPGTNIR